MKGIPVFTTEKSLYQREINSVHLISLITIHYVLPFDRGYCPKESSPISFFLVVARLQGDCLSVFDSGTSNQRFAVWDLHQLDTWMLVHLHNGAWLGQ
jgi:hypothetical protein